MSGYESFKIAIEPILPGLVMAALFMVGLMGLRIQFRGRPLSQRIKRPISIFYGYFVLFLLTIAAHMYAPTFFRILNLGSVIILTLAVGLSVAVGVFDLFLGHYRRVNVPVIIKDITILVVYVVVVVIVVGQQGVDVTSIVTTSAVLTAVIGFALQDLLSSIISGLAIEIERPFKVGDWVKFDTQEGKVLEINWRSTKIETLHLDTVIIPNNVVTRSPIVNFSVPTTTHRQKVVVGLPYGVPPNRAKASLMRALADVDGVISDPKPYVVVRSFDDFSISYQLYFYIDAFGARDRIEDRVKSRIWYQLSRDSITIPFPIRDVNLRNIDSTAEERQKELLQEERLNLLKHEPFLDPLSEEESNILARNLVGRFFGAGELILRQGDEGSSFYIIASGEVEVALGTMGATMKRVTTLSQYNFFGEMSLMTGERRAANIVAMTD
ncbi:mechanosensitive ion channel, partial [Myxococcota bacterium]|nr:mechanosensitive ion channel [Myxococcota bacterium]